MKFGRFNVADATGIVLGHALPVGDQKFKKGRVLSETDIERLQREGFDSLIGARIDATDVAEDPAARMMAQALAGTGVRIGAPFTGRCNLFAVTDGLLLISAPDIDRFNAVDEALTVATLSTPRVVQPGEMLATIKVIPFAVPGETLKRAIGGVGAPPPICVATFASTAVGVIQTRLAQTKDGVLKKTSRVLRARVEALQGRIVDEVSCDHDADAVALAISRILEVGAQLILIIGASAIVDRRDVIPSGITAAGGEVLHFGMPVDPGNLLLLARCHGHPVLGLPGCARSPKFNGLDRVLERLAAGLEVTPRDIMAMGVGGLLKETTARSQPRHGVRAAAPARPAQVAAVVLAAGCSTRMGLANKLLVPFNGHPMIRTVVEQIAATRVRPIVVVTGHEADRIRAALDGMDVCFAHNATYREGMSGSIRAGLSALPESVDAAIVCLGDMPLVAPRHFERLAAAFDPAAGYEICVPTWEGKHGNPVLFARRFFVEMAAVRGDIGARHLIVQHEEQMCEVAMDDRSVLVDVDSPQALQALGK